MKEQKRHVFKSGIVGNCSYIAHIGIDSNVNWLCWPTFEDSFIFGALLDNEKGGEFSIKPSTQIIDSKQEYLENTNILATTISCQDGKYRITDVAPRFEQYGRYYKPLMLIRKIEPIEGNPKIKIICNPKYNYGLSNLSKERGSNHVQFYNEDIKIRLSTNLSINHFFEDTPHVLTGPIYLILTLGNQFEHPINSTAEDLINKSIGYWQNWVKKSSIPSFYQKEVIRSALTLKIHQYEDTGAIIASSTTSLPEYPDSGRTWDYRFCWLRDSFYVLTSLSHIGHFEEMERYSSYIAHITQTDNGRLQPLYSILGKQKLTEHILDHLTGYMGNKPIRIGNQAYEHIQNDVYGQALIALLPLFTDYRFRHQHADFAKSWTSFILNKIKSTIDEMDAGIWEFRSIENRHCYSNLFQWAGATAAIKIANLYGFTDIKKEAVILKQKAAKYIEDCYDPTIEAYRNSPNSDHLDASTLQLIMMGYLNPNGKRAKKHLKQIEKQLKAENSLFYRYKHKDDFGKPKATFLVCAFWYVEALACVGRIKEAQKIFKELLSYGNHLMLFSEDVSEEDGSQWGNFPQAYSHVGLVNAAYRIAIKLDKPTFFEDIQ